MNRVYQLNISNGETIKRFTGIDKGSHNILIKLNTSQSANFRVEYIPIGSDNRKSTKRGVFNTVSGLEFETYIEDSIREIIIFADGVTGSVDAELIINSSTIPEEIFSGERGIVTQSYDSVNIKRGLQFELPHLIDPIAGETSRYILVEVGSKDIILKTREIDVNGGMEYRPWKNVTTYTKGSLIDEVVNLNGKSSTVNTVKFYEVSGVDLAAPAKSFDIVKSANDVGVNRGLGSFPEGVERIIPAGSVIVLEFKNTQTQEIWVVFKTTWYEGPTDVDPVDVL